MPTYVPLYRVRLTRDGYIMKGDRFAGQYRGVDLFRGSQSRKLYRLDHDRERAETHGWEGAGTYKEFLAVNRAEAVIQARKWLAQYSPGKDVRS